MKLESGPIPLYHQLEHALRARIHGGEFAPGALLPTEASLCEGYGVSRITVRRALDALIAQGLIIRRRGIGSFVSERRVGVRSVRLVGALDEFLATAGELDTRLVSMDVVDPPARAVEALRLAPGEMATRLELAAFLDNHAVGHFELFFPVAIGKAVDRADIEAATPTIRVIERKLNLRVVRAEQLIEADVAGETAARHLGLSPSDPVLRVTRIYFAADGRAVEAVFVRYHSERYRYAIDFHAGRPVPWAPQ